MEGLSDSANQIIERFSKLELLKDFQLIGGTALAIHIKHRISEDLDFCQWIPKRDAKYALDAKAIHQELKNAFGHVEMDHLDFHQVNYRIVEPSVRITFYQTDFRKPVSPPVPLIGNIVMANKEVLGGSKLFVITTRREMRDYYDLYVLLNEKHVSLKSILHEARNLSPSASPATLMRKFEKFRIDNMDLSTFKYLKPTFQISPEQYQSFFNKLAVDIRLLLPKKDQSQGFGM